MSGWTTSNRFPARRGGGSSNLAARPSLKLLRFSHIFASLVQDLLQRKPLREAAPGALTLSQFQVLKVIALNGAHQIGEVAAFLGMSAPAASKNIDKLERLGLLFRMPVEGDRRATSLKPTARGRHVVERYEELEAARFASLTAHYRPRELERFTHMLERVSLSLVAMERSDSGLCLRCAGYSEDDCSIAALRGECPYRSFFAGKARAGREEPS